MKTIDLGNDCELDCTIYGYFISFALRKVDKSTPFATLVWEWPSEKAMREEMAEMVKQDIFGSWGWVGGGPALGKDACIFGQPDCLYLNLSLRESRFSAFVELKTYLREQFGKVQRPEVLSGDVLICSGFPWVKFPCEYYLSATDGQMVCASKFDPVSVDKHYRNGELIWEGDND